MSHFYGTLNGQAGEATRRGSKNSGLRAVAASWRGAIETQLYINADGVDCARVSHVEWKGAGVNGLIYDGPIAPTI